MVNSFDDVISDSLSSVTGMFSLFDSITNMTKSIQNLDDTPLMGDLTVGGLERYRYCMFTYI